MPEITRGAGRKWVEDVHERLDRLEAGQAHIEAPGWLHATIESSGDGWRLVYARTPMLATLGIPGGRAELTGVDVG